MAETERLQIALDEARSNLATQHSDVSSVRDRASNTVQFGGLLGSFFGALTLRDGADLSGWTYVGVVAFIVVGLGCTVAMWPRTLTFSNDGHEMVKSWELDTRSTDDVLRHLIKYLSDHHKVNRPKVDHMMRAYTVSLFALVIEIAALTIDLLAR